MKKSSILLFFSIALLTGCTQNNDSLIPSGASMVLDADTLSGASSSSGTCLFTTWADSSGNGNHATINCAAGGGFAGTKTPADPNRIVFNGSSTFVSTNLNAQANVMPNATWVAWIKPNSTNFSHIFSIDDHAGAFNRALIIDNTTADFGVFNRFNNTWITNPVDVGSWQFIAVAFSSTDIYFYKNGTTTLFGNAPAYTTTAQTFTIGRSAGGSFDYFNGAVAWMAVYPRVLNPSEINSACRALLSRFSGATCN